MSTALWVGGAGLVVLAVFAGWRLRRAAGTVERILDEERERERIRVEEQQQEEQQQDVNSGEGHGQRGAVS